MSSWQKQPVSVAAQVPPDMLTQLPLLMQHGVDVEQVWPESAHIDVEPMSPIGGAGCVQVPIVEPGGMTQTLPVQQSAVVVQTPLAGTQLMVPHTRWPFGSGTHGRPLQQSAAEAQAPPGITHMPRP